MEKFSFYKTNMFQIRDETSYKCREFLSKFLESIQYTDTPYERFINENEKKIFSTKMNNFRIRKLF